MQGVKDLCSLLDLFENRGVGLVSVAESLDYGLGRRTPGDHHHGGGLAVGAGSDRGTDAGRAAPQAHAPKTGSPSSGRLRAVFRRNGTEKVHVWYRNTP